MVSRRPGTETVNSTPIEILEKEKMPHIAPLPITNKTTKGQLPVINNYNRMRQRLIDLGEMEDSE